MKGDLSTKYEVLEDRSMYVGYLTGIDHVLISQF